MGLALSSESSITKTAKDLGIPIATLHAWVKKARSGDLATENGLSAVKLKREPREGTQRLANISQKLHDQLSAEQRKNAELEKQVRRLTQEREILLKVGSSVESWGGMLH